MKRRKIIYIANFTDPRSDEIKNIGQQIAWLLANTPYELHVAVPNKKFIPTDSIPPTFTNIVYPDYEIQTTENDFLTSSRNNTRITGRLLLKKMGLLFFWERRRYKKFIKKYLKRQQDTDLFIIPIHSNIDFLSCIHNGSKIIGESYGPLNTFTYLRRQNWISKWRLSLLKRKWKKVSAIVVNNPKVGALISEYTKVPTYHIPHHLKIWPEKPNDTTKNKIVSAFGSYSEDHFISLIDVWQSISPRHSEWRLNLYGKGDEGNVKAEIKNRHLSWYIHCYPLTEEMTNIYLKSSVLILFSIHENIPRIKEGFSYGLPVMAFKCREISEIIHDEKDGFLIMGNSWKDLEIKTRILINNEDLRIEMSQHARETALNYKLEKVMADWCSLIENVSGSI